MIRTLFLTHSGWRHIVVVVAALVLVKLLIGLLTRGKWSRLDQSLGAALPIVMDIQMLLGLVLWLMQQRWAIPDPTRTWEHPVIMILAIAAAHITWSRVKKSDASATKYRTGVVGYAIAGLLLTVGILRITGRM